MSAGVRISSFGPYSHSPLVLAFGTMTSERHWTLNLQSEPKPAIHLDGNQDPTRDEIIACLAPIGAPVWMIEVVEVLAKLAHLRVANLTAIGDLDGPGRITGGNVHVRPGVVHQGECATDPHARQVCDGMWVDKCDDVIQLCAALRAVKALAGEDPQISNIVDVAIREHGGSEL